MKFNPLILTDFYKACHHAQFSEDLEYSTSYYTPRMTRIEEQDTVVMALLQSFLQEYFIETFDEEFFEKDKQSMLSDYGLLLTATIGSKVSNDAVKRVSELHDLGYLPIKVSALPEGTLVPIKVPMFEITNTHPRFAWLVNALETLMSTSLWHGMVSATVGYQYRQVANKWYKKTVDNANPNSAIGDFSLRGQESLESGIKSSSGFLLSHMNTASVPAIPYLAHYYDATFSEVGRGAVSTEHSVMCSNYSIDGNERTFIKKLITEIYPEGYVSIVSDSYDYWGMVDNILPSLKTEIMERKGTIGIRGDSGDPVDIVAGVPIINTFMHRKHPGEKGSLVTLNNKEGYSIYRAEEDLYLVEIRNKETISTQKMDLEDMPSEAIGTVAALYRNFGGTVNSKGYKVIDSHIKAVYGDGITQKRAEEIYSRLAEKGFSSQNVTLGAGSFSMQAVENEDGSLSPYTRDTFGVAIKATHGVMKDGQEIFILKNPRTDTGNFKKSLQGLIDVRVNVDGDLYPHDKVSIHDNRDTVMRTVFENGKLVNKESLQTVRNRLHNGKF